MKYLLLLSLICLTARAEFHPGFNQGWIYNRYGGQWGSGFDLREFERVMDLTRQAGGDTVRFWLFEGSQPESLTWDGARFCGLDPRFVRNLRLVMSSARARGIRLNLTLFDGNMGKTLPQPKERGWWWWNLLNNRYDVRERFVLDVYLPLLALVQEGGVAELDLVNELNAFTINSRELRFEGGWRAANRFVCDLYRAAKGAGFTTPITASIGWGDAVGSVLGGFPEAGCVDYFDVHVYRDSGVVPNCAELVAYARANGKTAQLGEFGQALPWSSDSVQANSTRNFLRSAKSCGLTGAYAWRLAEPEASAHLTFEKGGGLRPAYRTFQESTRRTEGAPTHTDRR